MMLASVDWGCGAGRDVLCVPHKWCPQAMVQAAAPVSAGAVALGMPKLRCEQAMTECGPTCHGLSSGSVKSSDDNVSDPRVAVRSGAAQLSGSRCRPAALLTASLWFSSLNYTKHTVPSAVGRGN
ncbi:hypothetical protein NDU88_005327 [Pleurodeles waltl]|uniref:Uncharacterized protein n=1 Tax=Pleurodeles waltl TaxID=8319 RepID=A0AAV7TAN6_PLEWA|nr:hypothetical protein NDU88_005327 [Pleurodeles waltl]